MRQDPSEVLPESTSECFKSNVPGKVVLVLLPPRQGTAGPTERELRPFWIPVTNRTRSTASRGQSLAEFALVVPILIILFVSIADFGRIFGTEINIEAASRDAAEVGSNQYLAKPPGPLDMPAPAGQASYYGPIHDQIAKVVCAEMRDQFNTDYDSATQTCPTMPLVLVCIHDSQDTNCGTPAFGASVPPGCADMTSALAAGPTPDQQLTVRRWVEVKTCYRFTTLVNVPLVSFGEFWLERTRQFTIPCYFVRGTPAEDCG